MSLSLSEAPEAEFVVGAPRALLRAEGAALGLGAVALYAAGGHSWLAFAALFLAPDFGFAAYLAGPRVGATIYNALHWTAPALALALAALGWAAPSSGAFAVALIWLAHIGLDRALGYGLKYGSGFRDTHLGRLGS
jgi:Domain of unknown function (DUF4260)